MNVEPWPSLIFFHPSPNPQCLVISAETTSPIADFVRSMSMSRGCITLYGPMLTGCSHTVAALVWVIQDYCESGGPMWLVLIIWRDAVVIILEDEVNQLCLLTTFETQEWRKTGYTFLGKKHPHSVHQWDSPFILLPSYKEQDLAHSSSSRCVP